jgi:hypothetical protein
MIVIYVILLGISFRCGPAAAAADILPFTTTDDDATSISTEFSSLFQRSSTVSAAAPDAVRYSISNCPVHTSAAADSRFRSTAATETVRKRSCGSQGAYYGMMRNQRLYSRDYLTAAKVNKKYLKLERYLSYSIFILSVWLAHTK